jgi:protein-disulfide isomerase
MMLLIGLVGGYFGRPLIESQTADSVPVAAASTPTQSPAGDAEASAQNPSAGTLMDAVVAQTRHFKGSPDAPVTIVEFSDFQ